MNRLFTGIYLSLLVFNSALAADAGRKPHILFLIGEPEYQTRETLTTFADQELIPRGVKCSFALEDPRDTNSFVGLENLKTADLLFVSVRRHAPLLSQMTMIRDYVEKGGAVAGIRTASHAFGSKPKDKEHAGWDRFDVDILGGSYSNHFGNFTSLVEVAGGALNHPILAGIDGIPFPTQRLYKNTHLAPTAIPLLTSHAEGETTLQYVAWVNTNSNRRVFYTSLGSPADFEKTPFRKLLINGIYWAMNETPSSVSSAKNSK
jgi:type 1 glutamine amidotransferase